MLRTSARARSDGFYFVYSHLSSDLLQLWKLGNTGAWSRVGIFPSRSKLPTGYTLTRNEFVLDGNNNAYALVTSSMGYGVARFPLGAAVPTIVYDEKNRPADAGWAQWPPKLYTMVNSSSYAFLVTAP